MLRTKPHHPDIYSDKYQDDPCCETCHIVHYTNQDIHEDETAVMIENTSNIQGFLDD